MPKPSLLKDSSSCIKPITESIRDFISFRDISLNLEIFTQLEFELAYSDFSILYVSHYTTVWLAFMDY